MARPDAESGKPASKTVVDSGFGLVDTLGVGTGDVISLVGAGGKTTILYALSMELRRRGHTVIATSTTRMQMPSSGETAPPLVVLSEEDNWLRTVKERLARYGSAIVVQDRVRDDKLGGVDPVTIDPMRSLADCVVVEADGARGRSLKAPEDHEPVVADETTVTVVVVGMDVLGQRLDESNVHRLPIVCALSRTEPGGLVDDNVIVTSIVNGYFPQLPEHGRRVVFLNKVNDERLKDAERLAEELIRRGATEVVFGEAVKPGACLYRLRRG